MWTMLPGDGRDFRGPMFSSAPCPTKLDEIGIYPNLGEDKIFNPQGLASHNAPASLQELGPVEVLQTVVLGYTCA